MKQQVICIAGAHRSGTSMLTRLLHTAGLALGPEEEMMPAAADNPDGFWENLRFVRLNDEILNSIGTAWDLPPWQDEPFDTQNFALQAKAKLAIAGFSNHPTWGWKDPRNCLTFPFWHSLLPELKTVIIVRNPLEVAYSMHRRNGTSYALALRLWEIYNRRLLTHTRRESRIVTDYQAFFAKPQAELDRIIRFVGLPLNDTKEAADLVTKDRRHTAFSKEQLIDAGVSDRVIALYDLLIAEATEGFGPLDSEAESSHDREVHLSSDPLAGARSKLDVTILEGETFRRELARRRGDEIEHRKKVAEFENLLLELGRRDGRITELQVAYAHLDKMLLREQAAREELRERFAQTNRFLHSQSIQLTERETEAGALTERLRKHLGETKRLLKLLDETDQAADLLRRSRRWILINPFAWLRSLFSGRQLRGFGHLDKNVEKYRAWKVSHPELRNLDSEIAALRSGRDTPSLDGPIGSIPAKAPSKPQAPTKPIQFPGHEEIEVSIVIPVFNQIDFTLACLASLQDHATDISSEVLVVDDCSTDITSELLTKIPGLVYLRNESNQGFIVSCNQGAKKARGKYLVFLNNDTVVEPGWLAGLRETFISEKEAGLVGSKLIYPDGRLQEAGGIIWRDASGWNRGKFQDAKKPEYNYLREVDYCSAASLMIPKSLFESLDGFNPKYAPAYYEDTDLAFTVRKAGWKVLYQPLSSVIHYEGATGGTDISAGTKKYQELNRATFATTWAAELANKPVNGDLPSWEALSPGQKRILIIDHHLPMPDRDSGSLRMFQLLKILHGLGHRVTFLPDNLSDIPPYGDNLRKHGIEVIHHPYINSARAYLEVEGAKFDIVVLSRCDFARKHLANVRLYAPRAYAIFDTVDLHFLRTEREAQLTSDPETKKKALAKEEEELALVDNSDETWLVSEVEAELLREKRPARKFEVVSNIVDVPGSATPFSQRQGFLFIGSFQHTPNIDAVSWFTREIYPRAKDRLGGAKFYIIGDKAPPEIIALADEQVIVTGFQSDVVPYFNSVKLSIAPLRFGAGVKGKINQSMAFGVPVVATTLAVEGMGLTNRKDVVIADDATAFADALVDLYESEELWEQLSVNGIELTHARFSPEVAEATLSRLFSANSQKAFATAEKQASAIVTNLLPATR